MTFCFVRRESASSTPVSHLAQPRKSRFRLGASASAVAATLLINGVLPTAVADAATVTWGGANGAWETPSNWIGGLVPAVGDNIIISTGNVTLDSSRTVSSIDLATGTNLVVGTAAGSQILTINSNTVAGSGLLNNNGTLTLDGSAGATDIRLQGDGDSATEDVTFTGTGSIVLQDGITTVNVARILGNAFGTRLGNEAGHTIEGAGALGLNGLELNNRGTIEANVAGGVLLIDLNGSSGTTNATFGAPGLNSGNMAASNGGTLRINGSNILNDGGLFTATGAGSSIEFVSTNITDLTIETSAGGVVGTFDSGLSSFAGTTTVTEGSTFRIDRDGSGISRGDFSGIINNDGEIALTTGGTGFASFVVAADADVSTTDLLVQGTGVLTLGATPDPVRAGITGTVFGGTLEQGESHTIQGAGLFGQNVIQLENHGAIVANVEGEELLIDLNGAASTTFIVGGETVTAGRNSGTLTAENGATLRITGSGITNLAGGLISADGIDSEVVFGTSLLVDGVLQSSGGAVVRVQEGTSSTFAGTTILSEGSALLIVDENTGTTTGRFSGTMVNDGIIDLGTSGSAFADFVVEADSDQETVDLLLTGSGKVLLDPALQERARINSAIFGGYLLNDTDHTIEGAGLLGLNTLQLANRGLISANQAGRELAIDINGSSVSTFDVDGTPTAFGRNGGTMQAVGGGLLRINGSNITNQMGGVFLADGAGSEVGFASSNITDGVFTGMNGGLFRVIQNFASNFIGDTLISDGTDFRVTAGTGNTIMNVSGTLTNNGTILLEDGGPASTRINILADADSGTTDLLLTGTGTVSMQRTPATLGQFSALNFGGTLVHDVDHTIEGAGALGQNNLQLENRGDILANRTGEELIIDVNGSATTTLSLGGETVPFGRNRGTMQASNGGLMTITGSRFNNDGGTFEAFGDGANTSQIAFTTTSALENLTGNALNGGTYHAAGSGGTDIGRITLRGTSAGQTINAIGTGSQATEVILQGAGSIIETDAGTIDSSLSQVGANGTLRVLDGRNLTITANSGNFRNDGLVELGGGTFQSQQFVMGDGAEVFGNGILRPIIGLVTSDPGATTTVRANGGILQTAGLEVTNAIIDAGASLNINQAPTDSTVDFLIHNGDNFNIDNPNAFTVVTDYQNANFGSGNDFDRNANVTGPGLLVAANAAQQVTAAGLSGGTLDLGDFRVGGGGGSVELTIANTGTLTTLRGAVKNTNASDVTVTGADWIAAAGTSTTATLNFAAAGAGSLAGQTIEVVNNFANASDTTIELAGTAWRAAEAQVSPSPTPTNVRVGEALSATVDISNIAPADGFSEAMLISGVSTSGDAAAGAVTGAPISAGDFTSGTVSLNTATAGAKSGSVTYSFETTGLGTSGLAAESIGDQTVNLSGNVFEIANPVLPTDVNFGGLTVGVASSQTITVSNALLASSAAFQEGLDAALGALSVTSGNGSLADTGGAIINLAAGDTDTTTLEVTFTPTAAGTITGSVQVLLASNGAGTSGLATLDLDPQVLGLLGNITGAASNAAIASVAPSPVNFGNVRIGDLAQVQTTISNLVAAGPFSDSLNVTGVSVSGNLSSDDPLIGLIGPQETVNGTLLTLDTSTAGAKSGILTSSFESVRPDTSSFALADVETSASGNVFRTATTDVEQADVFYAARVGDATSVSLMVTNTAIDDGFSEGLVLLSGTPTGAAQNAGTVPGLIAAGSTGTVTDIAVDTSTSGVKSGSVTYNLQSDGTGTSGLDTIDVGETTAAINGRVYQAAEADVTPSIDFGVIRSGTSAAQQAVTVSNVAAGELVDLLDVSVSGLPASVSTSSPLDPVAAGGSLDILFDLDTATPGEINSLFSIDLASINKDLDDLALPSADVSVTALVTEVASPELFKNAGAGALTGGGSSYTLDFGTVEADSGTLFAGLSALNDIVSSAFSELLSGVLDDSLAGVFDISSISAVMLEGGEDGGIGAVSFDTTGRATGLYTGLLTFNSFSLFEGLSDLELAPITVNLRATVSDGSTPVSEPMSLALLGMGLAGVALTRRRRSAKTVH